MKTPKFTDDELVVDRNIHNYLTKYGYEYNAEDKYYCFVGKNANKKTIFMGFYDPLEKKFEAWLKIKCLDDYEQCTPYIKSYYLRKRYLQEKGLIK